MHLATHHRYAHCHHNARCHHDAPMSEHIIMYYENDLLNLVKFPGCTQPPT